MAYLAASSPSGSEWGWHGACLMEFGVPTEQTSGSCVRFSCVLCVRSDFRSGISPIFYG